MRERGLKLTHKDYFSSVLTSLPMRERGLKLKNVTADFHPVQVAPHAGAWIETSV